MNQRPFAVFDIDGTIFRSSLFLEMTYRAIDTGIIPDLFNNDVKEFRNAWLKRKDSEAYEKYITEAVTAFRKHIVGVKVNDLQKIAKQTVGEFHEHSYIYTRDLLKNLKAKGYYLIAITGSPSEIANEFIKKYDFDYLKSTEMIHKDGRYLGLDKPADQNKQQYLRDVIKLKNLCTKNSFAVGDTKNDSQMLEMVENPIAFNPDKKLFKIAKENSWKIVVERKNMIYELESQNGKYQLSDTETI